MTEAVYFDNNGTTALDSRVLEAMLPYMTAQPGNATSRHVFGRTARQAIERAREQVADATGAHPSQVIFTGSGTESDNMAIYGITAKNGHQKIAISAIEHPAVSRAAQALKSAGVKTEIIAVDANSFLEQNALADLLEKNKGADAIGLVSVMLAHNETGVIQDITKLAEMDKRVDIQPLLYGGGQEKGLRSGSENLASSVCFGAACELVSRELIQRVGNVRQLRDRLEIGLHQLDAVIFGNQAERLANTSFFAFPNIEGETLLMALDRKGFAVASGSACSSDSTEPSHVLLSMGVDEDLARGSVRVSLANSNTSQQIEDFLLVLENELSRLRRLTAIAV